MDTDFPTTLIVNPSDVKVEPVSPQPGSPDSSLLHIKTEPGLAVKQEEPELRHLRPLLTSSSSSSTSTTSASASPVSLLKQPTIVITSRPTTRLLVPKLPSSSSLAVEETAGRWSASKANTKILVGQPGQAGQSGVKSSSRRAIDSHLISTNTVSSVRTPHCQPHSCPVLDSVINCIPASNINSNHNSNLSKHPGPAQPGFLSFMDAVFVGWNCVVNSLYYIARGSLRGGGNLNYQMQNCFFTLQIFKLRTFSENLHTERTDCDWPGHMGLMAILWFPQHFLIREF